MPNIHQWLPRPGASHQLLCQKESQPPSLNQSLSLSHLHTLRPLLRPHSSSSQLKLLLTISQACSRVRRKLKMLSRTQLAAHMSRDTSRKITLHTMRQHHMSPHTLAMIATITACLSSHMSKPLAVTLKHIKETSSTEACLLRTLIMMANGPRLTHVTRIKATIIWIRVRRASISHSMEPMRSSVSLQT